MISLRHRYIFFTFISLALVLLTTYYLHNGITNISSPIIEQIHDKVLSSPEREKPHPKHKPTLPAKSLPIADNFPFAAATHSAAELPPIPIWNRPPSTHVPEKTPLFIGFTWNWCLLQQSRRLLHHSRLATRRRLC